MEHPELILIFFSIAFLYASIGFGGGSSYIAILALYSIDFGALRILALICNISVVSFSVLYYARRKMINWREIWPLVGWSVPFAFIGGRISLPKEQFLIVLGAVLLLASILIFFKNRLFVKEMQEKTDSSTTAKLSLGAGIGFLSGMVGIGGGIFLSPVLHLIHWNTAKRIAAAASLFILVNSIAGLLGQFSTGLLQMNWKFTTRLILSVVIGGQLGIRWGTTLLSELMVRRMTAVLIFYVGIKLVWENL